MCHSKLVSLEIKAHSELDAAPLQGQMHGPLRERLFGDVGPAHYLFDHVIDHDFFSVVVWVSFLGKSTQ